MSEICTHQSICVPTGSELGNTVLSTEAENAACIGLLVICEQKPYDQKVRSYTFERAN